MKVGDKVQFRPELYAGKKQVTGRIVFIPQHGRYVRIRFTARNFFGKEVEHFECVQIANGRLLCCEPETRGAKPQ